MASDPRLPGVTVAAVQEALEQGRTLLRLPGGESSLPAWAHTQSKNGERVIAPTARAPATVLFRATGFREDWGPPPRDLVGFRWNPTRYLFEPVLPADHETSEASRASHAQDLERAKAGYYLQAYRGPPRRGAFPWAFRWVRVFSAVPSPTEPYVAMPWDADAENAARRPLYVAVEQAAPRRTPGAGGAPEARRPGEPLHPLPAWLTGGPSRPPQFQVSLPLTWGKSGSPPTSKASKRYEPEEERAYTFDEWIRDPTLGGRIDPKLGLQWIGKPSKVMKERFFTLAEWQRDPTLGGRIPFPNLGIPPGGLAKIPLQNRGESKEAYEARVKAWWDETIALMKEEQREVGRSMGGWARDSVTGELLVDPEAVAAAAAEKHRAKKEKEREEAEATQAEEEPEGPTEAEEAGEPTSKEEQERELIEYGMPNVVGMAEVKALKELGGFDVVHLVYVAPRAKKTGYVEKQSPEAGKTVTLATPLTIYVGGIEVPSVVGVETATAESRIRSKGLRAKKVLIEEAETVGDFIPGRVHLQYPQGGTYAAKGSSVEIRVPGKTRVRPGQGAFGILPRGTTQGGGGFSGPFGTFKAEGPPSQWVGGTGQTEGATTTRTGTPVTVPNVRNKRRTEAIRILEGRGLYVRVQRTGPGLSVDPDRVSWQNPEAGASVPARTTVTIAVTGSADVSSIEVPRVIGMSSSGAESKLTKLGFRVRKVRVPTKQKQAGLVVAQNPAPSTVALPGTTVEIRVGIVQTGSSGTSAFGFAGADGSPAQWTPEARPRPGDGAAGGDLWSDEDEEGGTPPTDVEKAAVPRGSPEAGAGQPPPDGDGYVQTAVVPPLGGLTLADADARLRATRLTISVTPGSDRKGRVVSQKPKPGAAVPVGSVVSATLQGAAKPPAEAVPAPPGPPTDRRETAPLQVTVPDLVGSSVREAKQRLQRIGLRGVYAGTPEDERHLVSRHFPAKNARVRLGTQVELFTALRGTEGPVPDTRGQPWYAAFLLVQRSGFVPVFPDLDPAVRESGATVYSQVPPPGKVVPFGTQVQMRMGPTVALEYTVPDLTGLTFYAAELRAKSPDVPGQFEVKPSAPPAALGLVVVSQIPLGGSLARRGSTIVVTLGRAAPPKPRKETPPPPDEEPARPVAFPSEVLREAARRNCAAQRTRAEVLLEGVADLASRLRTVQSSLAKGAKGPRIPILINHMRDDYVNPALAELPGVESRIRDVSTTLDAPRQGPFDSCTEAEEALDRLWDELSSREIEVDAIEDAMIHLELARAYEDEFLGFPLLRWNALDMVVVDHINAYNAFRQLVLDVSRRALKAGEVPDPEVLQARLGAASARAEGILIENEGVHVWADSKVLKIAEIGVGVLQLVLGGVQGIQGLIRAWRSLRHVRKAKALGSFRKLNQLEELQRLAAQRQRLSAAGRTVAPDGATRPSRQAPWQPPEAQRPPVRPGERPKPAVGVVVRSSRPVNLSEVETWIRNNFPNLGEERIKQFLHASRGPFYIDELPVGTRLWHYGTNRGVGGHWLADRRYREISPERIMGDLHLPNTPTYRHEIELTRPVEVLRSFVSDSARAIPPHQFLIPDKSAYRVVGEAVSLR